MTVVEEEASFPCLTTQGWSITRDADVENGNASPFPKPWPQVIYEPVKSTHGRGGYSFPGMAARSLSGRVESIHRRGDETYPAWLPRAYQTMMRSAVKEGGSSSLAWLSWPCSV